MSNVRRATTGGRRAAFVIVLHSMWRRAEGKFALIVLALWLLIAIVSLFWTPQSLWATDGYHVWAKPSAEHWLGTDGTGADVFSWLLAGSHTNLVIVLLTVVASMAWGLLLIAAMVARNAALASSSVVVVDALISVPTVLIAFDSGCAVGSVNRGDCDRLRLRIWVESGSCGSPRSVAGVPLVICGIGLGQWCQRVACAHKPCYAEYSAGIGCATVIVGGHGGVG